MNISPEEAKRRLDAGTAVLIDIREPMEHARENIPLAKLVPLSRFAEENFMVDRARVPAAIFHCASGRRTKTNFDKLCETGFHETYVLEGGIGGWKQAGLPTSLDRSKPIELQRQVQITAGSLVVLGIVLAVLVSPWFVVLSAFVGAGLMFAGISGWCGMARLLALMPWNRAAV